MFYVDLLSPCVIVDLQKYSPCFSSFHCLSSPHAALPQEYWHLWLYLKMNKVKMKAEYAISTLGDLYICTVNVFYFDLYC